MPKFTRKDLPQNLQDPATGVTMVGTINMLPEDYDPNFPEQARFDLEKPARGLYVGVEGMITVTMFDGSGATFLNVPAGTTLPIVFTSLGRLGTTAGELIALH